MKNNLVVVNLLGKSFCITRKLSTLKNPRPSQYAVMVEIHEALRQVPVGQQRPQVEEGQREERIQKDASPVQNVERAVPQEGDVDVVSEGHQPQAVAEQRGRERLARDDQVVEEELDKVQDDQQGEEGVQVHVEGVAPLDVGLTAPETRLLSIW